MQFMDRTFVVSDLPTKILPGQFILSNKHWYHILKKKLKKIVTIKEGFCRAMVMHMHVLCHPHCDTPTKNTYNNLTQSWFKCYY
jgi:hypothetical protein